MRGCLVNIIILCILIGCKPTEHQSDSSFENTICKVVSYYKKNGDTLGYKSALFLADNMDGLSTIKFGSETISSDLQTVSSEYLITNIDLSLKVSRHSIQTGKLSLSDFFEYVLPYRIHNEQLVNWRKTCLNKFGHLLNSRDDSNPKSLVIAINDTLRRGFMFSYQASPAQFLNWDQMIQENRGDCWTMTSLATYPLRALGVPVTTDFAPMWGNVNGGSHSWNVLIDEKSSPTPFMGCESTDFGYNPFNIYYLKRMPVKVFRKTFSSRMADSYVQGLPHDSLPPEIITERVMDVTDLYVPTQNIGIHSSLLMGLPIAYLATFSNGDWRAAYWAKVNGQNCSFKKMTIGILYLPTIYSGGRLNQIGSPFYLDGQKRATILKVDTIATADIRITHLQSKELDEQSVYSSGLTGEKFYQAMDSVKAEVRRSRPRAGEVYSLFYWDRSWKMHSRIKAIQGTSLTFHQVPTNTIYRITSRNLPGEERIFTYQNGRQRWW